ncbi:MAG: ribonuclease P protein component [Clostridia bacterium]|nr:ribonuclease P protein component [Clostridia bacterium]
MIKKEHRLTKNRHFQFIYRKGQSKQSKFITLIFVKTKFKPYKVGFSVSNKIGKSVVRSKVKRRLRESFNLIQKNINPNFNYVIVAKKGIDNLGFFEIKKEMEYCFKKANLINE